MIDQLSFALHRSMDPATSRAAAKSIDPESLEGRVLDALRGYQAGATTYQLAERMGLSLVTVSPRMRPLVSKGKVRDSGRKAKGESGRMQTIWAVAR